MDSRNSSYGHITPLRSIKKSNSLNSPGSRFVNSSRYSFFGTPFPKLSQNNSSNSMMNRSVTGPLLTSMNLNSNLSTYMDSKSPGLAERVAQYSRTESQKPCITHQPKYGSPGIFPVVHLYKKSTPIRNISSNRRVTVKLAKTPDVYPSYNSDNRNYNLNQQTLKKKEESSVIEALKQISRKRMIVDEDYDPRNNSKRQCREFGQTDVTVENQCGTSKGAPFIVNAITASLSSSHPHLFPSLCENLSTNSLQQKATLCNMETQTETTGETINTIADIHEDPTLKRNSLEKIDELPGNGEKFKELKNTSTPIPSVVERTSLIKEKQMESVKRGKLSKFLCLLSNEKNSSEITDLVDADAGSKITSSILSPENKPKLNNKHVTFDLAEKAKDVTDNASHSNAGFDIVQTKSDAVFNASTIETTKKVDQLGDSSSNKENVGFNAGQNNQNSGFTFGLDKEKESIPSVPVTSATDSNIVKPTLPMPQMFTPAVQCLTTNAENSVPKSNPIKLGGFKFDFKSPSSTPETATIPQFGTGDSIQSFNKTTVPNTIAGVGSITFGTSPQSQQNSTSTTSVSSNLIVSTGLGENTSLKPSLGSNTNVTSSSNTLFGFGTNSLVATVSSESKINVMESNNTKPIFSISNSPIRPSEATTVTASSASAIFSTGFGVTTTESSTSSTTFAFGSKPNNETKPFDSNFAIMSSQNTNDSKSLFPTSTTAVNSGFKASTTENNLFGNNKFDTSAGSFNPTTSSLSATPFPLTTATGASNNNSAFTSVFTNSEQKPNMALPFGTSNIVNPAPTTSTNENLKTKTYNNAFTFGAATSTFGNTFQFGGNKNNPAEVNTPKTSVFEPPATAKSTNDFFKFGSSNVTSNNASPFSAQATVTAAAFSSPTTLAASTFSVPTTMSAFNSAPNQQSVFNSGSALANSTSTFNTNTLSKPASTFSSSFTNQPFDLSATSKSTTPSFNMAPSGSAAPGTSFNMAPSGSAAPGTSFNMFGSVPTTMFNAQPNANLSFQSFGTNYGVSSPKFGTNAGVPAQFGDNNNAAPSQFGANNSTPIQFGANNNGASLQFGSNNNGAPPQFGANNNGTLPQFGASNNGVPPQFGGSNNGAPPQFGANSGAPPQYGASQPGMFNIGSGGTQTSRTRTTLKARRRT